MRALVVAGTLLALVAVSASLVWLGVPSLSPFVADPTPLQALSGQGAWLASAVLAVAAGVLALAGIAALLGRRLGRAAAVGTLAAVALVMLGLVGFDAIPLAGYSLAFLLPLGLAALVVALAVRRPAIGVPVAAVAIVAAVLVQGSAIPVLDFVSLYLGEVVAQAGLVAATLVLVALCGTWGLWSVLVLTRERGPIARAVLRLRVPITIVAAACALPYAVARASWLTPWPLFGGSYEAFDAEPSMRVVGLMLGAAMLAGGVLTLGLVLPWGRRVPSWLPG